MIALKQHETPCGDPLALRDVSISMMSRRSKQTFALLAGAVFALVALMPSNSEAAWWPWSKRQERAAEEQAAPPVIPEPGTTLAETDPVERLNQAEARIRELTGEVERLNFQLRLIQQKLGIPVDNELGEASEPSAALVIPTEPSGRDAIDAPAGKPIDLTAVAPSGILGEASTAGAAAPQVVSLGDPAADYERAYRNILVGDYEMADESFRVFLASYPSDRRAPDARYWLGESLYARGLYGEAADEFLSGYKDYPTSAKAGDTLLKLGLSLSGLGELSAACSTFAEVLKKFPDASNALKQRIATEQAIAGC